MNTHYLLRNTLLHTSLLFAVFTALALPPAAEAQGRPGYPKIFNIFLSNSVTPSEIDQLAKYDVLALDVDFPYEHPTGIARIRSLNPDIQILGYIPINGTNVPHEFRPPETIAYKAWAGMQAGDFWLYRVDGEIASDWPGKYSTNLTPNSPVNAAGEQYWEWFAHFVHDEVWQGGNGPWDGIMLDDVWDSISWLNALLESPVDSDRNGVPDGGAQLDLWWKAANDSCVTRLRELLGPDVPIMANGGNSHDAELNGTMIENFPNLGAPDQNNIYNYAWRSWTVNGPHAYLVKQEEYNPNPFGLMVVHTSASGTRAAPSTEGGFQRHKKLCLATALLGDGYFAMDEDWDKHDSLWWEPEYDIYIGEPLGPAYTQVVDGLTLWRRDYSAGIVVVNPNNNSVSDPGNIPLLQGWSAYIGPPPDFIPPDPVTVISAQAVSSDSVRLIWEAPGDGQETVASYVVRQSSQPIASGLSWIQATNIPTSMVPRSPGQPETLMVTGLTAETSYYFAVRAYDAFGNFAPLTTNAQVTTPGDNPPPPPGDTVQPSPVMDLVLLENGEESVQLQWTAPGDDGMSGTATVYRGRWSTTTFDAATWSTASELLDLPLPGTPGTVQVCTLTGLAPGTTYHVAIRAEDEAGNLGAFGTLLTFATDETPPPPPADTQGPSVIADLMATAKSKTWMQLAWSSPADSAGTVTGYEMRYRVGTRFANGAWNSATAVANLPAPLTPGTNQTVVVGGLTAGTAYAFRIRSVDALGNWSALSAVTVDSTEALPPPPPPDVVGPLTITDLAVTALDTTTLVVSYSAPSDSAGHVVEYDLRYVSGQTFDAASWGSATRVETEWPQSPGETETVTVPGLAPATSYAFRVKARDNSGNWSTLSAMSWAVTHTPPPPPPPLDTTPPTPITNFAAAALDSSTVLLTWSAPEDSEGPVASYEMRWSVQPFAWASATPVNSLPAPAAPGTSQSLELTGFPRDVTLVFAMVSHDTTGNTSALSNLAETLLESPEPPPPPVDTTPPAAIEGLSAEVSAMAVDLNWQPSTATDIAGYRLYRSRDGGGALRPYRDHLRVPTFHDSQVVPGRSYRYTVTAVDQAGNESATSAVALAHIPHGGIIDLPQDFLGLGEASPNPAVGPVSVPLQTGQVIVVEAEIFDVRGRLVRAFTPETLAAGSHNVQWDGADVTGRTVRPGIYFMRVIIDGSQTFTRKVHRIR